LDNIFDEMFEEAELEKKRRLVTVVENIRRKPVIDLISVISQQACKKYVAQMELIDVLQQVLIQKKAEQGVATFIELYGALSALSVLDVLEMTATWGE